MGDTYDYDPNPFDDEEYPVVCKFCGTQSLEWRSNLNRWALFDKSGNRHICSKFKNDVQTQNRMIDPLITINGQRLTLGQIATLRVALQSFLADLYASGLGVDWHGLGEDFHGKYMTEAYIKSCAEINLLIENGDT